MGHTFTPEGLKPSNEIVNAVLNMPQPQNEAATRRFLGTITYLPKFCPRLSEVVRPLRDLTHIDEKFLWADQHTEALRQAKELVSQAPCLRYFGVKAPVVLQVDACEYGLDATLQELRTAAATDPEQIALQSLIEAGWPNDKAAVPELARPYKAIRHELTSHDGLLFKQDRVIIPSSARPSILHKLHAARRGSSSPFDMLGVVSSCQGSTARSKTCARTVSFVHNINNNTLRSHSNLTLCPPYLGNWFHKTYLSSMAYHI
ncbi:hypothetical protein ACROYT_G043502 [Oculina patagonica]